MLLRRSYRFRIYPTPEQAATLHGWEDALRGLWNRMHAEYVAKFEAGYFVPTATEQSYTLTRLREREPWLAVLPRNVSMQLLHELDRAWQRFFKGLAERPRFKSRRRGDLAPLIEPHPKCFRVEGEGRHAALSFPKLGTLRAIVHREPDGTPKTCALVREGREWFAGLSCEIELADPVPNTDPPVGIDRGVVNLTADSDGRTVENPRPYQRTKARLATAQRRAARKKKGSENQKRARKRAATLLQKARRQREAVLHRETKHYAENQGVIFVEALNTRSMTASARGTVEAPGTHVAQKAGLNRAILDSGWGLYLGMLRYKCERTGAKVVEVPAAYSSQTCAECGHVAAESRRTQSEFECVACGHRANADTNAAKVLLRRGMRGAEGCGGDAIARPAKQQLRVARRRTRVAAQGANVVGTTKAPCFSTG